MLLLVLGRLEESLDYGANSLAPFVCLRTANDGDNNGSDRRHWVIINSSGIDGQRQDPYLYGGSGFIGDEPCSWLDVRFPYLMGAAGWRL